MNRLAHAASGCTRKKISLDAPGRRQLMREIIDVWNIDKGLSRFPPAAQVRFLPERTPVPLRPRSPLVAAGNPAHSSSAEAPSALETPVDLGRLAISIAFARPELVFRGSHSAEIADYFLPSFIKALLS